MKFQEGFQRDSSGKKSLNLEKKSENLQFCNRFNKYTLGSSSKSGKVRPFI